MQDNPFETSRDLRGRSLVVRSILALVVAIITNAILFRFSGSPLSMALFGLFLSGFFFLFNINGFSRADLSYDRLFGTFPTWRTLGQYALWVVPLVIVSIASTYVLYLPLSYVFPGFVKTWYLEESTPIIWRDGDNYILVNAVNYLRSVLIAPVMEEFFVRGILLTRWTVKWGVPRAVLASSIVFGLLHTDLIGGFCFACVMAIFYIRTKSLFIPISLHILNNLSVWIMAYLTMDLNTPVSYDVIADFQESWWIGLIALAISIPCVILFCRYYIPNIDWRVPYLSEVPNGEK